MQLRTFNLKATRKQQEFIIKLVEYGVDFDMIYLNSDSEAVTIGSPDRDKKTVKQLNSKQARKVGIWFKENYVM